MIELAAPIVRLIDRAVIRVARLRLESRVGKGGDATAALTAEEPVLFYDGKPPEHIHFRGKLDFSCDSPVQGVAPESRRIHGKFHRWGDGWRNRPAIIMLHGWNGENCFRLLFPLLALRFRRAGISLLSIQLPCHGKRRAPFGPGSDFISSDLSVIVRSTRQAIADVQAMIGWLKQEGCGPIGVWGISFGAWLAGLLACHDARLSWAVLMTPVVRMDRAIQELEFCAPIRRSLGGRELPFRDLSLTDHRPLVDRQNLLLVEGLQDLFAPPARVEELWKAWDYPPIERFHHGHMSMLFSVKAMMRTIRFVETRAVKR